jgi:hypothetical protein
MRVLTPRTIALLCAVTLSFVACAPTAAPSDPGGPAAVVTSTPSRAGAATAATTLPAVTSTAATPGTTSTAATAAAATAGTTSTATSAAATPAATPAAATPAGTAIAGASSSPAVGSPPPGLSVNTAPSDLALSLADLPTGLFNPAVKCPPLFSVPPNHACALFAGQGSFLAPDATLQVLVALRERGEVVAVEQRYCAPGTRLLLPLVLPHVIGDSSVACSWSVTGSTTGLVYTILYQVADSFGYVELRVIRDPNPTYNFALLLLLADRQVAKIRAAR